MAKAKSSGIFNIKILSYMNIELNVRHEADISQNGSCRRECVKITFPELVRLPGESDDAWKARTLEMNRQAEALSRSLVYFISNIGRFMSSESRALSSAVPKKSKTMS